MRHFVLAETQRVAEARKLHGRVPIDARPLAASNPASLRGLTDAVIHVVDEWWRGCRTLECAIDIYTSLVLIESAGGHIAYHPIRSRKEILA